MKRVFLVIWTMLLATSGRIFASEVTTLARLDCSIFTEGSELRPSSTDISGISTGVFYESTRWSSECVYAAGGQVLVGRRGFVRSPRLGGASAFSTVVSVTAVVRSVSRAGCDISFSFAENAAVRSLTTRTLSDNRWTVVTFVTSGATDYSTLTISGSDNFLLLSVVVECSRDYLPTPQVDRPLDFDGSKFTAVWRNVAGATSYTLEIQGSDGSVSTVDTSSTRVLVDGLNRGVTYFFTVAARNADTVSPPSQPIEVLPFISFLDTPANVHVDNADRESFTVSWTPVDNAESYRLTSYVSYTCPLPQTFTLLHENFEGVNRGTFGAPWYGGDISDFTETAGWIADRSQAFAPDAFVIVPCGSDRKVFTPELLPAVTYSPLTVSLELGDVRNVSFVKGSHVRVSLTDLKGNELDAKDISIISDRRANYNVSFSPHLVPSGFRIGIEYLGDNSLYIYLVDVAQTVAPDSEVVLFDDSIVTADTSESLFTDGRSDVAQWVVVTALARTVRGNKLITLESEPSVRVVIDPASVEEIVDDKAVKPRREGTCVVVEGKKCSLYTLDGRLIAAKSSSKSAVFIVETGTFAPIIAVIDGRTYKI